MKVSVIIPIYNVENFLEECLRSVALQTFRDFEVIAVDDCSTDASMSIFHACIQSLGSTLPRVTLLHHDHNRGLSAARNTGLNASQSDYVYFLDSDDAITPDCLELLTNASHNRGTDIEMVIGDYRFNGPVLACPHLNVGRTFLNHKDYIRFYCKERIYPMAWNRLIQRTFLTEHHIFFEEGLIHEDTLWNFQILQFIQSVGIVEHETYIYRVQDKGLHSDSNFIRHFNANVFIIGRMAEIMFSTSLCENKYVYNFVEQEKIRHLYDCYRNESTHLIPELYNVCRNKPHYTPLQAIRKFGFNLHMLKRILTRDRHYCYSPERGCQIFAKLAKI